MKLAALVRNWWMMAVRGGLAILFGLSVLLWPNITLSVVVLLFGVYAVIDGAWTVAAGARASARLFDAWPVVLEGVVSVVLGALALGWPLRAGQFVYVLAGWGLATGVLELLAAIDLPREGAAHWLLATAGLSSLFLAGLILLVRRADADFIVRVIAVYAQVFGIALLAAAICFPREAAGRYVATRG
ncbi:MAG TPA: DUF308 domain-containing protein [Methylomirabilota bacterium]|nr:DUF308 domain-containing protein [Methylomirabilota bacterium]